MTTTSPIFTQPPSDLASRHLLEAIQSADAPQTISWIVSKLSKPLLSKSSHDAMEAVDSMLNEMIQAGEIWRFGKPEKALYWHSPPKVWIQRCLLNRLAGRMKSKSEVLSSINGLATVKDIIPKSLVEGTFKELLAEGRILKHPSHIGGRTAFFSIHPTDPTDYLSRVIEQLVKKLNVSESELAAAAAKLIFDAPPKPHADISTTSEALHSEAEKATPSNLEAGEYILQAMRDVNPAVETGDVVLIRELRERLDISLEKPLFDQAILDLSARGIIALHRDDFVGTYTSAQRELLVSDGHGKFYSVASLRRNS